MVSAVTPVDLRQLPPNLNHWYAIARSIDVGLSPHSVTLWEEPIVLYRSDDGQIHALEDRCPHRNIKLSHGTVEADRLVCAYHAWTFDDEGICVDVPYLADNQKLPSCTIRSYPVREQNGFIWAFPGDEHLAQECNPIAIPEWDHLNYITTVSVIDCEAHFSFLIENLMDMYHGHLHRGYQAWASANLDSLDCKSDRIDAHYTAQSYYRIDKIWAIGQIFIPAMRQLHPEPLDVSYCYPNWRSSLGEEFRIYCLFIPVSATHTRAHLIHFTSLNAFWRLHRLPDRFRRLVKDLCFGAAQWMLDGLVREDVVMLEDEQQAYLVQPDRHSYELNKTVIAVQKLIRSQAVVTIAGKATGNLR
jgi:renierapurpurin 18,18'-hydroxylase